jgi:hypothetical protein
MPDDDAPIEPDEILPAEAADETVEEGLDPRHYRVLRSACIGLMALGGFSALLSLPGLFSPGSVQCSVARQIVEDAADDDKKWNDIDLGGKKADDLSCAEAIAAADRTPEKEGSKSTEEVVSEDAIRLRAVMSVFVGVGQLLTGVAVGRTGSRKARNLALAFAGMGMLVAVLGVLSLIATAFILYALSFSPAARERWPRPGR